MKPQEAGDCLGIYIYQCYGPIVLVQLLYHIPQINLKAMLVFIWPTYLAAATFDAAMDTYHPWLLP